MTFRRELTEADLVRMRIPVRYWNASPGEVFDNGEPIDGKPPNPNLVVNRYLERIGDFQARGAGLLLWGPNGVGKTCAGVVALKEFRRRTTPAMFLGGAEISRAVINRIAFDDETSLWDRAMNVGALFIDDIGKGMEDSTGFGLRMFDELIRHRNANRLVTWGSTNLTKRDLMGDPEKGVEPYLKRSTLSTVMECMVLVPFQGQDRRRPKAGDLSELLFHE